MKNVEKPDPVESPTRRGSLELTSSAESCDVLTDRLDAFIQAWEQGGGEPAINEFLPHTNDTLGRMVTVELVKVDLEYRHNRPDTRRLKIEDYLEVLPLLADGDGVPVDLIFEEYQVRKMAGESVSDQEYMERFPDRADKLRRLLAIEDPTTTCSMAAGLPSIELLVGDTVDDFTLLSLLGKGAFGSVFLARQNSLQRLVALKVTRDRGRETQTLAQLDHPNIVRVFDQRGVEDQKMRLMYMQYVAGGTLQDVIKRFEETAAESRQGELVVTVIE